MKQKKHRRGDKREDGMIFWSYRKNRKRSEYWVDLPQFVKMKDRQAVASTKRSRTDEGRDYAKKYNALPKSREKRREYESSHQGRLVRQNQRQSSNYKEYHKEYHKKRRGQDVLYKTACNARGRVSSAFKNAGYQKNTKTADMLGCDFDELQKYLEDQFTEGMTWDNMGDWHIDHRLPLASAKTKKELVALCHYTNLQPLWARDNISKGDRYCADELSEYLATHTNS